MNKEYGKLEAREVYARELWSNEIKKFRSVYSCAKHYGLHAANISKSKYFCTDNGVLMVSYTNDFDVTDGYNVIDTHTGVFLSFIPAPFKGAKRELIRLANISTQDSNYIISKLRREALGLGDQYVFYPREGKALTFVKTII